MSDFESDVSSTAHETPHLIGGILTRSQTASGADSEEETQRFRRVHARDRSSAIPTAASTPNTLVCGTPAQLPRDAEGVESGGATPATARRVAPEPDQKVAESARRRIISESQHPESGDSHGGQDTDEQEVYSLEGDADRAATAGADPVQPPALVFTGMPRHGAGGDQVRSRANSRDVEMHHQSTDTLPSGHDRTKAEERPALTHSATALPRHVAAAQDPVTEHHAAGIPSGSAHEQSSDGPRAASSHDTGPAIDFCGRWPVNRRVLLEALREMQTRDGSHTVMPAAHTRVTATAAPRSREADSTVSGRRPVTDSMRSAQTLAPYRSNCRTNGVPRIETFAGMARTSKRRAVNGALMDAQTRAILNYEDDTVVLGSTARGHAPASLTAPPRDPPPFEDRRGLTEEQCNSEPGSVARLLADLARAHAEQQPGYISPSSNGSTPRKRGDEAGLTAAEIKHTVQEAVKVAVSASYDRPQSTTAAPPSCHGQSEQPAWDRRNQEREEAAERREQDRVGSRGARQLALAAIGRSSPPRTQSDSRLNRKRASAADDEPPPLVEGEESESSDSDPEFSDYLDIKELQRYGIGRRDQAACLRLLTEQRKRSKASFKAGIPPKSAFNDYLNREEIKRLGVHPATVEACLALLNAQRHRCHRKYTLLHRTSGAVKDLSFQDEDTGLSKPVSKTSLRSDRGDVCKSRCNRHQHDTAPDTKCTDQSCTACQAQSVAQSYYSTGRSDGRTPSRRPSLEWADGDHDTAIEQPRRYESLHNFYPRSPELDANEIGLFQAAGRVGRERRVSSRQAENRSLSRGRPAADVKLPSFGGGNWLAFFQQFISACDANRYSPQQRGQRLRCALTGSAMNLLTNHGSEDWSYQQLVEALEARHGRTKAPNDVENQLNDMRKRPNQSALEFADALDTLASKAKMSRDHAAAATYHAFKNGLRDYPSMHKYVLTKDKERSLRSAANLAAEWERSIGSDSATVDAWAMLEAHRTSQQDACALLEAHRTSQQDACAALNAYTHQRTEPPKAPRPPQGIPQGAAQAPAMVEATLAKVLKELTTKMDVVYDDAERRKAYVEKKQQSRNKKRKEIQAHGGPPHDQRQRDPRQQPDQRQPDHNLRPDQRPPNQNGPPNQPPWPRQDNRPQNQDAWPRQDARPQQQNA